MPTVDWAGVAELDIKVLTATVRQRAFTQNNGAEYTGAAITFKISAVKDSPPLYTLSVGSGIQITAPNVFVVTIPALPKRYDYYYYHLCVITAGGVQRDIAGKIYTV
jgi:hypothetical protein